MAMKRGVITDYDEGVVEVTINNDIKSGNIRN